MTHRTGVAGLTCSGFTSGLVRDGRLAMELLRRREATGMSREEVARQLEWSTSTLFRIETGRSRS